MNCALMLLEDTQVDSPLFSSIWASNALHISVFMASVSLFLRKLQSCPVHFFSSIEQICSKQTASISAGIAVK